MANKDAGKPFSRPMLRVNSHNFIKSFICKPRPIAELYDLKNDPFELQNLAGNTSTRETEDKLREALEAWMIRESDFLPLPSHALQFAKKR